MMSRTLLLFCCLSFTAKAQTGLAQFEKQITEFTLENGMHFIVLERHQAPVVSFHAYVNSGSADDPAGKSGLAHMFEHMIGKGTTSLGTSDSAAESKALAQVETLQDELEAAQRNPRPDAARIAALQKQLDEAIAKADSFVEPNAYTRAIDESGGSGFNASTGADATQYFYSLPANRIELWFLLQSQWFRRPVFREFYKERDVVREERRMRVESSPVGKLQEMLLATAFAAHPYRNLVGWASDIEHLRAKDAEAFWRTYYVPINVTIAIVGDVDPRRVRTLATQYFASLPAAPPPPPVLTVEPTQEGQKTVTIVSAAQPYLFMVYQRAAETSPDDSVLDVIANILSGGRTGLLYQDLVRDRKISLGAAADATFPAGRYPNLFFLASVPLPGHTIEENQRAIEDNLARLRNQPIDAPTLNRVKTKVRAQLLRQLDNNAGLAAQLCAYQASYGDWRRLFTSIDELDKVTAADVQRVARQVFTNASRTLGYLTAPEPTSASAPAAKETAK